MSAIFYRYATFCAFRNSFPNTADATFRYNKETLTARRQRWSRRLRQQDYESVISEVLDEELPKYANSSIIDPTDRISHMHECALILASAPLVFAAAVDGTLAARLSRDGDLQNEYATIQARAHVQPSIYIHLLTDDNGLAPTPNQYLLIRDVLLDYLAQDQASTHAWHLDNITHPPTSQAASAQGHRKYLHTNNRSATRVHTLRRFCDGVQARVSTTSMSLWDIPFQFPPGECGYSIKSHDRLARHRARHSSNYVMNLVEDICTYLHRTGQFQQHFRMQQYIIYLIFRPFQAAIAEIFCSGLLQVYVENGGGFNAYRAGLSVATARRVSMDEWDAHEAWVRRQSPVDENMRSQQRRAEQWTRETATTRVGKRLE
ncbi:hypothetical protein EK21DRAFT_97674 [Setomelanomma holmii]|uniref:Uncharacterized protein n=1 Tax=Setomelanomma holmii TaxID=210430 RepID=A0A9P4HIJ6_9PLEO|nr:hypothetical protein EK21DRAFT_97674 [Setomelanomma holmii]